MTLPVYPSNQLENADLLVGLCGSLWQDSYGGRDQARAFAGARGQLDLQVFYDIQNLSNCGGWRTTPLYRRVRWYPLALLASEATPVGFSTSFPAPATLIDVATACSTITDPAVALVKQIDFTLDDAAILFALNPFSNPLFPVEPVLDEDGFEVDQKITLWLYQADFDELYLYNTYGYVLGISAASTVGYRRLLGSLWDAMVGGSARAQLDGVLTALTGAETAITTGEVVAYVTADARGKLVITDQHVYRYHPDATILVSVDDVLVAGQYLADTFEVFELNRGVVPSSWSSITLPTNYLLPGLTGALTFVNSSQATTYIADDGFGYAELQFPITGAGPDVTAFRAEFQSRGRDINRTLAMCLDNRTNPVGQPGPTNVPSALNPAELVVQNVLRYHALLVTIQENQLAPDAFGLEQLTAMLRLVVPPWCAVLTRLV